MKPTLVVLAAGMGSRYGSLKQLDGVGPSGETIIDYSVYDAIRAGFGKVVFIIRDSFAEDFKQKITSNFDDQIDVQFAYQAVNTPIEGIDQLPEREKPWGTGHAVLVAKDLIDTPFAVVNADDYYGSSSMKIAADFLTTQASKETCAMVGFQLNKTLSENGSVSRGVCMSSEQGSLVEVIERTKIYPEGDKVFFDDENGKNDIDPTSLVSMNLWGFHPSIFDELNRQFVDFVKNNMENPRAEFYIPLVVNNLIEKKEIDCKVLSSAEKWYGVTYQEDKSTVVSALQKLTAEGKYPQNLWAKVDA